MTIVSRVLDAEPVPDLATYLVAGGGRALAVAAETEPDDLIEAIAASGLRGRGGAGFPTAIKWRTVADSRATVEPTAVVVNAAEGEPGTFKDRAIIRRNPYRVLEGALIAARAVGAPEVVVAIKASFRPEIRRLRAAIAEFEAEGLHDIEMRIVEGPSDYLFGEESALLEVVEGRYPFPRVTPPYRRGLDDPNTSSGNSSAWVDLAREGGTLEAPALIDNVETMANIAGIILKGPDWFREVGTPESPGTIVCTITGDTQRHAVGEFPMGTPLWDVIDALGGGPRPGRTLLAAISGTANSVLEATQFDTPLSYEGLQSIGSGLGTGGFIVFDDHTDFIAVAQGVAQFLSVESCGQCVPCKSDGLAIAQLLETERMATSTPNILPDLARRFASVEDGARCALAGQQRTAVKSLAELGREPNNHETTRPVAGSGRFLIAPIVDLVHGRAVIDNTQIDKLPDWSNGGRESGTVPAELYGDASVAVRVQATRIHGANTGVDVSTLDEAPADSGPSEASRRFTEPIVASHERLLDGLRSLRTAASPDRRAAAASLGHELGRYVSLVGTVVYPELDRMAEEGAGDLAWVAERNAESALEILQGLRSVDEVRSDADRTLAFDLRALIDSDDTIALPLLCHRLGDDELNRLADAVNEVVASRTESTARSSFGSASS
ncbi:MAG: NADH:ubiquinone oxidoreductase subunit F (NADH-binding) [Ilumatobacter sp.]|jgi:NADH-quinone oxidoreductase subunit F